jgi:splicing factor 3B subunit 2
MKSQQGRVMLSKSKARKLAKRQREEQLAHQHQLCLESLRVPSPVFSTDRDSASEANPIAQNNSESDDRVEVEPRVNTEEELRPKMRRHEEWSLEELKIRVAQKYCDDPEPYIRVCTDHDGHAEDPLFLIALKMLSHSVPVPRHWDAHRRQFNQNQTDRALPLHIMPAAIEHSTKVREIRKAGNTSLINQRSIAACFATGSPFSIKTFGVPLSRHGDVFYEGKWLARSRCRPGFMSEELRAALGMRSATAPPPWIHKMQSLKQLPPAYLNIKFPGINAPVPLGASWGSAEGQWGNPPRNEHNSFLFPGVTYDTPPPVEKRQPWGSIPVASRHSNPPTTVAPAPPQIPAPTTQSLPQPRQPISAVSYATAGAVPAPVAANMAAPVEKEFIRVDSAATTGLLGARTLLAPKGAKLPAPKPSAPPLPAAVPPTKF